MRLHQRANPADQKTITTVNRYVSWPLSVKHAAKITFAQWKCRTFQSIIYPAEKKNFIGISSILAWGKSRVRLPPPFIAKKKNNQVSRDLPACRCDKLCDMWASGHHGKVDITWHFNTGTPGWFFAENLRGKLIRRKFAVRHVFQ